MFGKDFVLAGQATFTLEIPEGFQQAHGLKPHYTFRVTHKPADERWPEAYFVAAMTGPDNEQDFRYLGVLGVQSGTVRTTAKSWWKPDNIRLRLLGRVLRLLWDGEAERIEQAGFRLHHEGRCGRCGRKLTTPESVKTGIGPVCAGKRAG